MKKAFEGALVKFTFEDGVAPLEFDVNSMSAENMDYAIPFGMCHRLGDMAAIPRKDGLIVTEQMRHDAIKAGMAHYADVNQKEWNMKGGTRPAPQNPAIAKLAAAKGMSYEQAQEYVANLALQEMSA